MAEDGVRDRRGGGGESLVGEAPSVPADFLLLRLRPRMTWRILKDLARDSRLKNRVISGRFLSIAQLRYSSHLSTGGVCKAVGWVSLGKEDPDLQETSGELPGLMARLTQPTFCQARVCQATLHRPSGLWEVVRRLG